MTNGEYIKTRLQIGVLQDLMPVYSGKTLDNVLQGLQARVEENENKVFNEALNNVDDYTKKLKELYDYGQ